MSASATLLVVYWGLYAQGPILSVRSRTLLIGKIPNGTTPYNNRNMGIITVYGSKQRAYNLWVTSEVLSAPVSFFTRSPN
jgi:hypothetical protein